MRTAMPGRRCSTADTSTTSRSRLRPRTRSRRCRARLVERGASNGAVEDLGAFHSLWFEDPDGMHGEVTVIVDRELRGIHEPRPLAPTG